MKTRRTFLNRRDPVPALRKKAGVKRAAPGDLPDDVFAPARPSAPPDYSRLALEEYQRRNPGVATRSDFNPPRDTKATIPKPPQPPQLPLEPVIPPGGSGFLDAARFTTDAARSAAAGALRSANSGQFTHRDLSGRTRTVPRARTPNRGDSAAATLSSGIDAIKGGLRSVLGVIPGENIQERIRIDRAALENTARVRRLEEMRNDRIAKLVANARDRLRAPEVNPRENPLERARLSGTLSAIPPGIGAPDAEVNSVNRALSAIEDHRAAESAGFRDMAARRGGQLGAAAAAAPGLVRGLANKLPNAIDALTGARLNTIGGDALSAASTSLGPVGVGSIPAAASIAASRDAAAELSGDAGGIPKWVLIALGGGAGLVGLYAAQRWLSARRRRRRDEDDDE